MRIGLLQLAVTHRAPDQNRARAETELARAARQSAQVVLLPELWVTGYDFPASLRWATGLDEGPFAWMAAWARTFGIWVGGSHLERTPDGVYNTFALYSPTGLAGVYRKRHLFGPLAEPRWLRAGREPALVPTPWGPVGLAICYDLRFPELFRWYARAGAWAVWLIAAWPQRRLAHWRALLQARAIENQYFVVGLNRVGMDVPAVFGGESRIVDPWGETLARGPIAQPARWVHELTPARVLEARREFASALEPDPGPAY